MTLQEQITDLGRRAHAASRALAKASTAQKNDALMAMADALECEANTILSANQADLARAHANSLSSAMIDRLTLTPERILTMADGIRQVAALPDPVAENLREWTRPNGIQIRKVRVPIGVVGIIYESRPNVTSDAAVLCTKTGNATILRGGSESIDSNLAIAQALQHGLAHAGLPADSILLVATTDRDAVKYLCALDQYLNVIVPRGGKSLIEAVVTHARMPVIKHYDGLCIIYVDREADATMARQIVFNGKTQRPGVCNAVETVLVHAEAAEEFFATTGAALLQRGVELRCDEKSFAALSALGEGKVTLATEQDFRTEFLDLILAVKVVPDIDAALLHIDEYGSHHSDAIITSNAETAERFLNEVDSATVYWNASTRFTDGGEFGFGAEIGISTDRLHARGPMALEELTTYKYQIRGTGQIRE